MYEIANTELIKARSELNKAAIAKNFSGKTLNPEEIKEAIFELISKQMKLELTDIKLEHTFKDDLGCDSLDVTEIFMNFEDLVGMEILDEEAKQISTIQNAIDYLIKKVHG